MKKPRRSLYGKLKVIAFPIEGPVTRKYMLQWNKMNPNYYLCVYGYEGLDENTDSILFVNSLRPFILPP